MIENNPQRVSSKPPQVSIGMPVYNGEKYIAEALGSVLSQTYPHFELLISDNASNDKTQEICLDYCKKDQRIKYVRHESNRGGHWNFNYVTQNASGHMVTWLACDDLLEPRFLELSVEQMSENPNTVLVSCDFTIIDQSGQEIGIEKLDNIRSNIDWNRRRIEFFKYPISNVYLCIYGMMKSEVSKSILKSVREPKIASGSELPILARFAVVGEISSLPVALRKYRIHSESVFTKEVAEIAKESVFRRNWSLISNRYRLRVDQLSVLFSSSLPTSKKLALALKILLFYARLYSIKAIEIPLRIGRNIGS